MAILKGPGDGNRQQKNNKAPLPKGDVARQGKLLFGSYSDTEIVLWLKALALDPCKPGASQESNQKLRDQILNVRKVMLMTSTQFPQRKRKLEQYFKGKTATNSGSTSEKYNQQNCTKLSRAHISVASSTSCLLNSADSTDSLNWQFLQNPGSSGSLLVSENSSRGKQVATNLSFLDNAVDFCPTTIKYSSSLIDSDESVNGSNPQTPPNFTLHGPPLMDADDTVHSSYSSSLEEPKQLNFRRMPIPIGPRFQAEVPDWIEPVKKGKLYGVEGVSEDSRWLGTRVWPVGGGSTNISLEEIGKGRPDSCSCFSPGSSDCIKHHIIENRLRLRSELGPAFSSWKIYEMGEVVSNSWTCNERKSFDSLVQLKQVNGETNYWKKANKCFPSRSKKSILSYYFNVFIPRRMKLQIKSCSKQVDSDDEEIEDANHKESEGLCKAKSDRLSKSNDVKTRYLRQAY